MYAKEQEEIFLNDCYGLTYMKEYMEDHIPKGIDDDTRSVCLWMIYNADLDGYVYYDTQEIIKECELDEQSIQKAIDALIEKKFIIHVENSQKKKYLIDPILVGKARNVYCVFIEE